jgi:hypothetical protein
MRITFPAFRKINPVFEGQHYDVMTPALEAGEALKPRHIYMLHAIGVVMSNCLKDGANGSWHGYDNYMTAHDHRLAVLCGEDGDMHVFMHAQKSSIDGGFTLRSCVGKLNDAPMEKHYPLAFDFIRKQGWSFDESCNYAVGNPTDPAMYRVIQTYHNTLRMLYRFRAEQDPIRLPLPHERSAPRLSELNKA